MSSLGVVFTETVAFVDLLDEVHSSSGRIRMGVEDGWRVIDSRPRFRSTVALLIEFILVVSQSEGTASHV